MAKRVVIELTDELIVMIEHIRMAQIARLKAKGIDVVPSDEAIIASCIHGMSESYDLVDTIGQRGDPSKVN